MGKMTVTDNECDVKDVPSFYSEFVLKEGLEPSGDYLRSGERMQECTSGYLIRVVSLPLRLPSG